MVRSRRSGCRRAGCGGRRSSPPLVGAARLGQTMLVERLPSVVRPLRRLSHWSPIRSIRQRPFRCRRWEIAVPVSGSSAWDLGRCARRRLVVDASGRGQPVNCQSRGMSLEVRASRWLVPEGHGCLCESWARRSSPTARRRRWRKPWRGARTGVGMTSGGGRRRPAVVGLRQCCHPLVKLSAAYGEQA